MEPAVGLTMKYFRILEKRNKTNAAKTNFMVAVVHYASQMCETPIRSSEAFLRSALSLGIPGNPDFNANDLDGVGYCQFTQKDGRRCSTSTAYLTTARNRPNLDIWTDTHVTGILFNGRQATSVVCRRNGVQKKIEAAREIIISCGAEFSRLADAVGHWTNSSLRHNEIELVQPLEGVGQNLQDHPIVPVRFLANRPVSLLKAKSLNNVARYLLLRRGMLCGVGLTCSRMFARAPICRLLICNFYLWLCCGWTRDWETNAAWFYDWSGSIKTKKPRRY